MRVAFLFGSNLANYLEDLLYAGLVAHFGPIDYAPAKEHFSSVRPTKYPEASCWTPGLPAAKHHADIVANLDSYDLIILGQPITAGYAALFQEIVESHPNAVLVNGNDQPEFKIMEAVHPNGKWFVRELDPYTNRRNSLRCITNF